jgi:hypothetical protein
MHWLLEEMSKLSISNTILVHKAILKPIWTYGIQMQSMASTSNIEILECFQSEVSCMIVDTLWYVLNMVTWDLQTPTVKEEIHNHSSQYTVRLSVHPNNLVVNLTVQPNNRQLRRHMPNDLPTRF